jgi:hypothetical protein
VWSQRSAQNQLGEDWQITAKVITPQGQVADIFSIKGYRCRYLQQLATARAVQQQT